jgi:hypothetical protein
MPPQKKDRAMAKHGVPRATVAKAVASLTKMKVLKNGDDNNEASVCAFR